MSCYPSPTTSRAFLAFVTLGLYSYIYGQSSHSSEVMNLSVLFPTILSPEAFSMSLHVMTTVILTWIVPLLVTDPGSSVASLSLSLFLSGLWGALSPKP